MTPANKIKTKEIMLMSSLLFCFFLSLISGYFTYFYPNTYFIWRQWTYLAHAFIGLSLCFIFPLYLVNHFRRTIVFRQALVSLLGILLSLFFFALCLTGLWIIYFGQKEAERWVYDNHIYLSYLVITLIFFHFLLHFVMKIGSIKKPISEYFSTISEKAIKKTVIGVFSLTCSVLVFSMLYYVLPSPFTDTAVITPYEYSYGSQPFSPSHSETTTKGFLDPKRIGNSGACGTCHSQIFDEWKSSVHAQAASDPTYVKNVNLLEKQKGTAATRFCEGCHAPVALFSGQLTQGGKHGGVAGTLANKEGVGCMGCHGIVKAIHQKGNASYVFQSESNYLFDGYDNLLAKKINHFLLRLHPQEHIAQFTPPIEKQALLCATCHESFIDKEVNNWGWLKMQTDYSTWLNSHYSASKDQAFSQQDKKRCQDCHMPLVKSTDPSANAQQQAVSHRTLGANTALPWLNNDNVQLEKTIKFLQSAKVFIDIEEPSRDDSPQTALFIDESLRAKQQIPYFLYLGETGQLNIVVSNVGVGHDFPGGTRDINQVWIHLVVSDAKGQIIYESGFLNKKNEVDKNAHFYRTIAIDRKGQSVWKHDLFHMTGYTYKNAIPPGKSDIINYSFDLPFDGKGPLTAIATLKYRKFNQAYARWALNNDEIKLPIVDLAQDVLTIPISEKKSAFP